MVILNYAGIGKNNASGVSVIVPRIVESHARFAEVGLFNYDGECFDTADSVVRISDTVKSDDYHDFPEPFNKPDLVLVHSPLALLKFADIAKKLKKDGIPYVIVPHGCFSSYAMKKKRLKKLVARVLYLDKMVADAAKIQYLSLGEQRVSVYKKKDSFIVPNGIDLKSFNKKEQGKDILEFAFIGRKDMYHKGLDILLEAWGKAKDSVKGKACLKIYGPASEQQNEELESAIQAHGLNDVVFNEPAVFGAEKENAYLNTDVFVLTSLFEGQPVAILEAWSYGVPTLVTPGTNVWEECRKHECGWAVERNSDAIAQTIIALVNDGDGVRRCAQNAFNYVCNEYNWQKVSDRYYREFNSLNKK
jgi:glycosyltransferase involved in cell wall biosynthesis